MPWYLHAFRRRENGPTLLINCPVCKTHGVQAPSWNLREWLIFLIIPIPFKSSWVLCSACNTTLLARRNVLELKDSSPEQLEEFVVPYVDLLSRVMAIFAILLGWFPFLGLLLALIAVAMNDEPGIWKSLSRIGLWISIPCHVLVAISLLWPFISHLW